MSKQDTTPASAGSLDGPSAVESQLGQVLALIHRILPRLDEPQRAGEVQSALRKAVALLDSACQAHQQGTADLSVRLASAQAVGTDVAPEIAAVIAAAVAVLFKQPYRLVSVHQVSVPVPHLNVWALEGRTQIFQSHKVR
jgi:hypothetical protein